MALSTQLDYSHSTCGASAGPEKVKWNLNMFDVFIIFHTLTVNNFGLKCDIQINFTYLLFYT